MGKTKAIRAVEIRAEVRQIKTMADGSLSVTLNLPEDCKEQGKILMDWHGYEVKAVIEYAPKEKRENRRESLG